MAEAGAERLGSAGLKLYTSKLIAPVVELSALRQVLPGKTGAELLKKHYTLQDAHLVAHSVTLTLNHPSPLR